jgi:hypothetical protein
MSLRNALALLLALSGLLFLAACGSSGSVNNPVAPPSGGFTNSNLNGTYIFSVSGTDIANEAPYAMVGSLTANGSGGLTGVVDINDEAFSVDYSPAIAPLADATIANGSYSITADGRGQARFTTSNPVFTSVVLDFVVNSSSSGLVTEFDANGTGSGTIDVQTAGTTPTGAYAFSLSGGSAAAVGNFTLSGGTLSGLEDFNDDGIGYAAETLSGDFVLGPSASPSTTLSTTPFSGLFDVFAIDATHLKFIEMDSGAISGDAYSQTTTTIPASTMAFTMAGAEEAAAFAAGGFMTFDGGTGITGTEDVGVSGNSSPPTITFSGNYTPGGTGRYTLTNFAGTFDGGSTYAAYPYSNGSSSGLLWLEIEDTGITAGAAYTQSTPVPTLAAAQGYGLNLSGFNSLAEAGEVDDIAEFAVTSSGTTVTGLIDENSEEFGPNFDLALSGTYSLPDTNGRGQISATAGTSTNSTANGGFLITYYSVDGTNFPFVESDGGQVATGVFVMQSPTDATPGLARKSMFVVRPMFHSHTARQKKN